MKDLHHEFAFKNSGDNVFWVTWCLYNWIQPGLIWSTPRVTPNVKRQLKEDITGW